MELVENRDTQDEKASGACGESLVSDGNDEAEVKSAVRAVEIPSLTRRVVGFVLGICASFFIAVGASCVQVCVSERTLISPSFFVQISRTW